MPLDATSSRSAEFSDAEKTAVEEQVERLIKNPHFSHSRRFPSFLRFVVRHVLDGQADLVKERTLGIEIFGRSPDYDTASDPIVRVTAAEIRKRIAQYYEEPGHEAEIRISLPPGSYIPQFVFSPAAPIPAAAESLVPTSPAIPSAPASVEVVVPASSRRNSW